jgi:hypothetical protein
VLELKECYADDARISGSQPIAEAFLTHLAQASVVLLELRQSRTLDAYFVLVTIFRPWDHQDESGTSSSGVVAYVTPNRIIVYGPDTHIHPIVLQEIAKNFGLPLVIRSFHTIVSTPHSYPNITRVLNGIVREISLQAYARHDRDG